MEADAGVGEGPFDAVRVERLLALEELEKVHQVAQDVEVVLLEAHQPGHRRGADLGAGLISWTAVAKKGAQRRMAAGTALDRWFFFMPSSSRKGTF
jgi:hypothetical protein